MTQGLPTEARGLSARAGITQIIGNASTTNSLRPFFCTTGLRFYVSTKPPLPAGCPAQKPPRPRPQSASRRLKTSGHSGFPPPPRQDRARRSLSLFLPRFPPPASESVWRDWFSSPAGLQHRVKGPPERKTCGGAALRTRTRLNRREQRTEESEDGKNPTQTTT